MQQSWHEIITENGCLSYINDGRELKKLLEKYEQEKKRVCFCTGCCAAKSKINDIPKKLYKTHRIIHFINYCESNNFIYGILSGINRGIFWSDEIIEYYDFNPPKYTHEEYQSIGALTRKKCKQRQIDILILYGPSPRQSRRVFAWLKYSKMPWHYMTKRQNVSIPRFF